MSKIEKNIFQTYNDLKTYLTSKGFIYSNNDTEMRWGNSSTQCYWSIDASGVMNFTRSDGAGTAFRNNLTDWFKWCGCIFIPLLNNGCALYLTPLPIGSSVDDLTVCSTNNYHIEIVEEQETIVEDDNLLENGLVICTPPEQDNYWRYTWKDKDLTTTDLYKWAVDNTHGYVSSGKEIPLAQMIPANNAVTLTKAFLQYGRWSDNIYVQVLGDVKPPSTIYKINGQKYINFCSTEGYRCPVFKLPAEEVSPNPSTSTEGYSNLKTYKIGDYCIYNDLLYKCIVAVTTPQSFDDNKWVVTTVHNEVM